MNKIEFETHLRVLRIFSGGAAAARDNGQYSAALEFENKIDAIVSMLLEWFDTIEAKNETPT